MARSLLQNMISFIGLFWYIALQRIVSAVQSRATCCNLSQYLAVCRIVLQCVSLSKIASHTVEGPVVAPGSQRAEVVGYFQKKIVTNLFLILSLFIGSLVQVGFTMGWLRLVGSLKS